MDIGNMAYFALEIHDYSNISRICVDTLRHEVQSNTVEIIQFGRDDHKRSSRDEEATFHARKRTA